MCPATEFAADVRGHLTDSHAVRSIGRIRPPLKPPKTPSVRPSSNLSHSYYGTQSMQRRSFLTQFLLASFGLALIGCSDAPTTKTPDANLGSAAAPGSSDSAKRIIILTNGNAPFWDAAVAGAKDAEKELKCEAGNLSVTVDRGDFAAETQINKLRQYGNATDVVGVGISVTDSNNEAIVDEMKKLQAAGIKVVTIDSDVDRSKNSDARFAYLGTDNSKAGQQLGKAAKGIMESANYAAFVGLKGAANAQERVGGFQQAAGDTFKQLDYLGDAPEGPDKARSNVRDALDRNKDLNLLVGIWSYNTPAIIDIVTQLKLREKTKIVGFDADPPAIDGMQAGMVDAMIVQNPYQMGYQGVRVLKALVEKDDATVKEMFPKHGEPGGEIYDTGLKLVVPDEGSPLKAEMFDTNTQFLKLGEFKAWLQKYNLTGS